MHRKHWGTSIALIGAGFAVLATGGARAEDVAEMDSHESATESVTRTATVQYAIPQVTLVRDDGKTVSLAQEMNDGRPVVLNFIFTSCGSICPLMSAMFAQLQKKLGSEAEHVHLMSISTDPEADTPARLIEYAQRFGAGPEWQHYTGTLEASLEAQRAFDVYRGDRMSHTPVTLMRAAPGQPWKRIDGFLTPNQLLQQYRQLVDSQ